MFQQQQDEILQSCKPIQLILFMLNQLEKSPTHSYKLSKIKFDENNNFNSIAIIMSHISCCHILESLGCRKHSVYSFFCLLFF